MNATTIAVAREMDETVISSPSRLDTPKEKNGVQQTPSQRKRFFSLKRVLLACLIAVAGCVAVKSGHKWWTSGRFIESTDDSYVGGDVTVMSPKVAGFITQVAVEDNQPVHTGDLLIKLDDRDYKIALAKAEAVVANQQATLANLDATRRLQEAIVAQAEAEVAATDAETSRAREDQARYQMLSANAAVSVQSFEKADADYKRALAAGEKSKAGLSAAQRQLDVIATQKQQAQAALDRALAERDMAKLDLTHTELRAPMDGVVGNRSARMGAYAAIGSQLISLAPSRGLWIDAHFKESQLARIHPGMPARIKIDSVPGQVFCGRVASIAPATGAQFSVLPPENATGNFTKIVQRVTVRIVLDDESATQGQLRPGLSVVAEVDGHSSGKAAL